MLHITLHDNGKYFLPLFSLFGGRQQRVQRSSHPLYGTMNKSRKTCCQYSKTGMTNRLFATPVTVL